MGRKGIPINLKATSTEGVVTRYSSIPEAAAGSGFSERGVRKAYHEGRNRTGEYQLEWLKPEGEDAAGRIKRMEEALNVKNCMYCGKPLTKEDRIDDGFRILRLGKDGHPVEDYNAKSFYHAIKLTRLTFPALINAAEKGNTSITRRTDKAKYLLGWGRIHKLCFEVRRQRRREGKE